MRGEEVAPRISQSGDRGPDPEAAADLAEHLGACPDRSRQWEALQQAESILSGATLIAPPPGFRHRVMARVASEQRRSTAHGSPARSSPRAAFAAAGIALLFPVAGAILIGASLAWNVETLAILAAQTLVLALVEFSGALISVDAILRAIAVIWGTLPAPAGQVILYIAGLAALAVVFFWARLVGRYGWGARATSA
jgi:hypothetical protein